MLRRTRTCPSRDSSNWQQILMDKVRGDKQYQGRTLCGLGSIATSLRSSIAPQQHGRHLLIHGLRGRLLSN